MIDTKAILPLWYNVSTKTKWVGQIVIKTIAGFELISTKAIVFLGCGVRAKPIGDGMVVAAGKLC